MLDQQVSLVRLRDSGRTVAASSLGARPEPRSDIIARREGVRGWGGTGTGGAFATNDGAAIVFPLYLSS